MDNSEQSLADEIAAGRGGYSADMAKAMGWKRRSGNIKLFSNGGMVASPPQHPWLSPDGTRHASCPDYENNPRHAFDECAQMGWGYLTSGNDTGANAYVNGFAAQRTDTDITRAINEALCRAVGV